MLHLVHGIRTPERDKVVPGLIPYLKELGAVSYPDYGYILAVETRRINPVIVGSILPYIMPGDVLVGHSNGCAVIMHLLDVGISPAGIVFINGALKNNFTLPERVPFAHVYFNAGDDITEVAEVAEAFAGTPVDEYWGDLGHVGYTGADKRVTDFNCGATGSQMPVVDGHSDIFSIGKIEKWGPFIAEQLREALHG
jgi:hypothetical protein